MSASRRVPVVLTPLGLAVIVLGWSKVHAAWVAKPAYSFTQSFRLTWAIAYIAVLALGAYVMGFPDRRRGRWATVGAAVVVSGGGAMALSFAQLATGSAVLPRFVVGSTALVVVPWLLLCADLAGDLESSAERRERVVVLADRTEALLLDDELKATPERPAVIVAMLEVDNNDPVTDELAVVRTVERERASLLVLSRQAQSHEHLVAQASLLHARGVRIRTLNQFHEEWLGKMSVAELERIGLLFDIGELHRSTYARVKRLTDIAVAVAGLPLLALVTPVVVIGNRLGNRGPLLFRQERIGRSGATFTILKFRTMRPGGDGTWTTADDPRITGFGRWLRRTHLDELPQLWNIARGDLSLVGPRPEQPQYVERLSGKIPFYDLRHVVRPGLTGWAQVKFPYGASESDALEKLQYEFYYLRRQSLVLDARIMVRTLRTTIRREGR